MIASVTAFKVLVAALVAAAAWIAERGLADTRAPRRVIWIIALVLSWAIPEIAMTLRYAPSLPQAIFTRAASAQAAQAAAPTPPIELPGKNALGHLRSAYQQSLAFRPGIDGVVRRLLPMAQALVAMVFAACWFWVQIAARRGRVSRLDGTEVIIHDTLGPAVIGVLKPRILVPRWLMDFPKPVRAWVLAHERSHIAAGDSLLMLAALVFIFATGAFPAIVPMLWQFWRLKFAVEVDCDRRVLRASHNVQRSTVDYCEALLAVGALKGGTVIGAVAMAEHVSELERRITILCSSARPSVARPAAAALAAILLVTAALTLDAPLDPYPRLVQWIHSHGEVQLDPQVLQAYAGTYQPEDLAARRPWVALKLGVRGNHLVIEQPEGGSNFVTSDELTPRTVRDFLLSTVPHRSVRLTFNRLHGGVPDEVIVDEHGTARVYRRIDDDAARAVQARQESENESQEPLPGSAAAARAWLIGMLCGRPDYGAMTPAVQDAARADLPALFTRLRGYGALQSVAFTGVGMDGLDGYRATFEHGAIDLRLLVTPDRMISATQWVEVPLRQVAELGHM